MRINFKNKKTVLLVSVLLSVVVLAVGAFVWLKYHQASADEFFAETLIPGSHNLYYCNPGENYKFVKGTASQYGSGQPLYQGDQVDDLLLAGKYKVLGNSSQPTASLYNGLPIYYSIQTQRREPYYKDSRYDVPFRVNLVGKFSSFQQVNLTTTTLPENFVAEIKLGNGQTVTRTIGQFVYRPDTLSINSINYIPGIWSNNIAGFSIYRVAKDSSVKELLESCDFAHPKIDPASTLATVVPHTPYMGYGLLSHISSPLANAKIKVLSDQDLIFSATQSPASVTSPAPRANTENNKIVYQVRIHQDTNAYNWLPWIASSTNNDKLLGDHSRWGSNLLSYAAKVTLMNGQSFEETVNTQTSTRRFAHSPLLSNVKQIDLFTLSGPSNSVKTPLATLSRNTLTNELPSDIAQPSPSLLALSPLREVDNVGWESDFKQLAHVSYNGTSSDLDVSGHHGVSVDINHGSSPLTPDFSSVLPISGNRIDIGTVVGPNDLVTPYNSRYFTQLRVETTFKDYNVIPETVLPEKYIATIYKTDGTKVNQDIGPLIYQAKESTVTAKPDIPTKDITQIDFYRVLDADPTKRVLIASFGGTPPSTPTVAPSVTVSQTPASTATAQVPTATPIATVTPRTSVVANASRTATTVPVRTATVAPTVTPRALITVTPKPPQTCSIWQRMFGGCRSTSTTTTATPVATVTPRALITVTPTPTQTCSLWQRILRRCR